MEKNDKDKLDILYEELNETKTKLKVQLYYVLIVVMSTLILVFMPMLGSKLEGGFAFPTTAVGWVVYIVTKCIVGLVNVMILYCFIMQAETNVRENENYKRAKQIIIEILSTKNKKHIPISPSKYKSNIMIKKGLTVFLTSILGVFALSEAVLTYNWVELISYTFTMSVGIIFGLIKMKDAEEYWTNEYLAYALYKEHTINELKGETNNEQSVSDRELGERS